MRLSTPQDERPGALHKATRCQCETCTAVSERDSGRCTIDRTEGLSCKAQGGSKIQGKIPINSTICNVVDGDNEDAWVTDEEDEEVVIEASSNETRPTKAENMQNLAGPTPRSSDQWDTEAPPKLPDPNPQIENEDGDKELRRNTSSSAKDGPSNTSTVEPSNETRRFPAGSIIVEVYGSPMEIGVDELCTFFWRNVADGPCEVCGGDFQDDKGPPIRTMSAGPGRFILQNMTEWPNFYIRVHNRHLDCIEKCQIPIIPVSHVWSEGIARANMEQKLNVDAITEVFLRPLSILQAATLRFFEVLQAPVEIWHDYFSVPQFCRDIQERLLLALPEIYRMAPFILIDLDDIPAATIRGMFPIRGQDDLPSLMQRLSYISSFFKAHWFSRMWVNLEYAFCKRACVLTSDNCILFWNGAEETRDSFSLFRHHAAQEAREIDMQMSLILPPHLHKQYQQQRQGYTVLGPSAYRRLSAGQEHDLTYGEALEHLSRLDCRNYRDRFIAMAGMLSIGSYRDTTLRIPKDAAAACLWIAKACLQRGDYSPLLLTPCQEQPFPSARWLVGHEKMRDTMCFLGRQTHPSTGVLPVLDTNGGRIKLEMQYVGEVIHSWYVDFWRRDGDYDDFINFNIVAEEILSTTGPSAKDFVSAILRVYCVPLYMVDPEIPNSLAEYEALEKDFVPRLEKLLAEYGGVIGASYDNVEEITRISRLMIKLLRLDRPYRSNRHTKYGPFTRLTYAGSFSASEYYRDSIDLVECPSCEKAFVYRVYHYNGGNEMLNASVYRIQGLGYEGTLPNGVGLVVKNGRIVGKMVYGTPACECQVMRVVEVS